MEALADNFIQDFTVTESKTVAPPFVVLKDSKIRSVVGVVCALSVIGSLFIILSYVLFRDLRSNARLLLVHLSISDLGVSLSNLVGEIAEFGGHFKHSKNDYKDNLTPPSYDHFCNAQAFLAHYFTISSVLWTLVLSTYMYAVTTKLSRLSQKENLIFNLCACVICYGIALFNSLWFQFTDRLGFSPYSSSGWCGSKVHNVYSGKLDFMAVILGYDIWIVLTSFLIIVTYLSILLHIREEKKKRENFKELSRSIDYKFVLIPVAFVFLRVWSFIHDLILVAVVPDSHLHNFFIYMAGIGDSGQGVANAILFVIFTQKIRQRYIKLFCSCCYSQHNQDNHMKKILTVNKSTFSSSYSHQVVSSMMTASEPMLIGKSAPALPQKNNVKLVGKSCDTSTTYGSFASPTNS